MSLNLLPEQGPKGICKGLKTVFLLCQIELEPIAPENSQDLALT